MLPSLLTLTPAFAAKNPYDAVALKALITTAPSDLAALQEIAVDWVTL